jgi:hypothetical protein
MVVKIMALSVLTNNNPRPGKSIGGKRRGEVQNPALGRLLDTLFGLVNRCQGRLSYNESKAHEDGGPQFKEAWATLKKCLPQIIPNTPPKPTIVEVRRRCSE